MTHEKKSEEANAQVETKLLQLIESGWLKARPISRMIRHPDKPTIDPKNVDKINALLAARRRPGNNKFKVKKLDNDEIEATQKLFNELQQTIAGILYLAALTPGTQEHNDVVQDALRKLLKRKEVDTTNLKTGLSTTQAGRISGFVSGDRPGKRAELDIIFERLRQLLETLSS